MCLRKRNLLRVTLVSIFFVPLEGITVKPVRCPTNKIAPHRRSPYVDVGARAFGGDFYDLLRPGAPGPNDPGSLQERPQEDDPDDCGDIEDYDETDLSALAQPYTYLGRGENRFFFGNLFGNRPNPGQPQTTHFPILNPTRPTRPPPRPTYMPAHPYWSGGYFGSNNYRPPVQQDPSDHVKPVHDGVYENHATYRPEIVGGPLGHVVGHPPVRPTTRPPQDTTRRTHHTRYSDGTTPPTVYTTRPSYKTRPSYTTRPSRPRAFNNNGIVGSFFDLLFK